MEKDKPYKNRYKTLPTMFQLKTDYALTLNAEDQHGNFDDRITRMIKYYRKRLSKLHFEYKLHTEISTPLDGRPPRVHLHGIMNFDNITQLKRWYNTDAELLSRSMHVDIDTIGNITEWSVYCSKNQIIMGDLTKNDSIIESVGFHHNMNAE